MVEKQHPGQKKKAGQEVFIPEPAWYVPEQLHID
jgi:hypothetical protein